MVQKIEVIIDYDKQYIEMKAEGASSSLHIEGVNPNIDFFAKVIANYLIPFAEEVQAEKEQ